LANLRWLEPNWSEARLRKVVSQHFENVGRLMAEFSILHRLMSDGRIAIENAEVARKALRSGPVILLGAHVGNWEVLSPVMAKFGVPVLFIFEPPSSLMQARLSLKARFKSGPPGSLAYIRNANAARAAVKWLKEGGTVIIFCDEASNGISATPFFGRPPHLRGNYKVAVRLARLTGGALLPFHVRRHAGCRFTMRFEAPVALAPAASLLEDVVQLNNVIEPIVRAHLGEWFWLDWVFAGLKYSSGR
jgi:KDO2-lipid IV(A) lauroyltransferase